MMRKIFLLILVVIVFYSCDENTESVSDNFSEISENIDTLPVQKVYLSLPAPMEIASIIRKHKDRFDVELINPIDNVSSYLTTEAQAFNMGVYIADLSFAVIFNQQKYIVPIYKCTIELADNLGIMDGFDDSLRQVIEINIEDLDSLQRLLSSVYFNSDAYLKENGRERTTTQIMIGAWIESFYFMVEIESQIADVSDRNQLISGQKLVLDNILEAIKVEPLDSTISGGLIELSEVITNCATTLKEEEVNTQTGEKITVSKTTYECSDEKIKKISEKISDLRKKLVSLQ